ncbi:hypothetical protein ACNKHK_09260 [Shigella flexneri]
MYLSQQGSVDLHGFATNGLYYKSLLQKPRSFHTRVPCRNSEVCRRTVIRDDMSAAREADSRWIGELWQNHLDTGRCQSPDPCSAGVPLAIGHAGRFRKSMVIPRNMRSTTNW